MLAIGRCLMGAPELVMFDEPSLGLAPTIVQSVLEDRARLEPRRAHLRAGGAERGRVAQARQPRLCAGERPRHARRHRRRAARPTTACGRPIWGCSYFSGGPMVTVSLPTPSTAHSILSPATVAATPGRRAGHDDVAGFQRHHLRQLGNRLRHVPDHLVEIAVLAQLAVHLERDAALGRMADLARGLERPAGRRMIERLADSHGRFTSREAICRSRRVRSMPTA